MRESRDFAARVSGLRSVTVLHALEIWDDEGCFQPMCSCGWTGEWESVRDNAEAEWHRHADAICTRVLG